MGEIIFSNNTPIFNHILFKSIKKLEFKIPNIKNNTYDQRPNSNIICIKQWSKSYNYKEGKKNYSKISYR